MTTIGLIASLPEEIKPFLKRVGKHERTRLGPFPAYRFRLHGEECLLVEAGMGLKRAMEAAEILLAGENPRMLVSFGVAGGVEEGLTVGDVVLADGVCLLEQGELTQVLPLFTPSEEAFQRTVDTLQKVDVRLVNGTSITTRGIMDKRLVAKILPHGLSHPVLEMETAGIALRAGEKGTPLLALRGISDPAGEELDFSIDEFTDQELNIRIGKVLATILRRPRIIPQLARLARNTGKAAENLAEALIAVIGEMSPHLNPDQH